MIRRIKLLYQAYNFFHRSKLAHNIPLYESYGINKKYYSSISWKDLKDIPYEENKYDVLDSREHLYKESLYNELPEDFRAPLLHWSENGYAVLPHFFNHTQVDEVNREVDALLSSGKVKMSYENKKLMFGFKHSKVLKKVGEDSRLIAILQMLLDKKITLFQSINFLHGSEQQTHSDSIHMSTFPPGNMIAVWIALEDVGVEQGPLHYYPGSHTLPYITQMDFGRQSDGILLEKDAYLKYENKIEETIKNTFIPKSIFTAKKGDILIWHANLLHGGNKVLDPSTSRKSMVCHYFASDAICYHEITKRPALLDM